MRLKKSKKKTKKSVEQWCCIRCGKPFDTPHGLDVHVARMHNVKAKKVKVKRGLVGRHPDLAAQAAYVEEHKASFLPRQLSCLEEATQVVRQRRENYGSPRENFNRIGVMWSQVLGRPLSNRQVGLMMICVKIARDVPSPQRDNLVDIAGYVDCIDVIAREEVAMQEMPT